MLNAEELEQFVQKVELSVSKIPVSNGAIDARINHLLVEEFGNALSDEDRRTVSTDVEKRLYERMMRRASAANEQKLFFGGRIHRRSSIDVRTLQLPRGDRD